ncbi:hypothetical protein M3Y99_01172200 [Aphelenchoides fujianensis]|nr:hypothetical protein M3Y99_01172200 [Aphelenchoides fujianensis]
MEEPPSSESDVEEQEKLDIREGVEITIRHEGAEPVHEPFSVVEHPHVRVEQVGKLDKTRLYVSDKECDAAIYYADACLETSNCSKTEIGIQYEHMKLTSDMQARVQISQKMERFIRNTIPIIEEEIRQNNVLERVLW